MQKKEVEWMTAFRAMSPEAQDVMLKVAISFAEKYPAPKKSPLRLVSGRDHQVK
jgi:hypothetical protein